MNILQIFRLPAVCAVLLFSMFCMQTGAAQNNSNNQESVRSKKAEGVLIQAKKMHGFGEQLSKIQNLSVTLKGSDHWLGQGQSPDEPIRIRYYHQKNIYDFEKNRYYRLFKTRNDFELTHYSKVIVGDHLSYFYDGLSKEYVPLNQDNNPEFSNIILSRFPEPREYLSQALNRPETLAWEGETLESGNKMEVISFVNSDSSKWKLYLDSEKLLRKVEGPFNISPHSFTVPVHSRYYDKYRAVNGVNIPYLRTELISTGSPYESRHTTLEVVDVEINIPLDEQLFTKPESIVAGSLTSSPEWHHREVSEGVHFIEKVHSNFNAVFVEMEDYVVAFDAPIDDQLTKKVLEKIKSLSNGKPVKYVIASHFHYDHIGGLREYAKQGAAIILPQEISSFVKEFVSLPETGVDEVENQITVSDDSRQIEIYNMKKNPHSEGMLFAYIPDAEAVIVADLFWKENTGQLRPARLQTRLFHQKLISLEKNIATLIPLHFPLSKMEDLENSVELFESEKEAITQNQQ